MVNRKITDKTIHTYPKFVKGASINYNFSTAREALNEARNLVAVQGYECRRNVEKKNIKSSEQMPQILCYNINDEH